MNKTELAYLAGFFDGEGCVTISRVKEGNTHRFVLWAQVTNTNPSVLKSIQGRFRGSIRVTANIQGHKPVFRWCSGGRQAYIFLKTIRPFLRMKCEQADIGMCLQETKKNGGITRLSPETYAWRNEQVDKIRSLNKRGVA